MMQNAKPFIAMIAIKYAISSESRASIGRHILLDFENKSNKQIKLTEMERKSK